MINSITEIYIFTWSALHYPNPYFYMINSITEIPIFKWSTIHPYIINSITEIPVFTWSTPLLKSLFLRDQLHYWNPCVYRINSITEIPIFTWSTPWSTPLLKSLFYVINSITQIPIFTWSTPLLKSQFLHDQLHYWNPSFYMISSIDLNKILFKTK